MQQNDKNIAGIILDLPQKPTISNPAALTKIGDITFIEAIVVSMRDCESSPVLTLGVASDSLTSEAEKLGIFSIICDSGKKGEIPALKKALIQVRRGLLGALIVPVTYPRVSKNVYRLLCHVFQENPDRIIIPIYKSRRGYPLILPASILDKIIEETNIFYLDDFLRAHSGLVFEQLVNDSEICRELTGPVY